MTSLKDVIPLCLLNPFQKQFRLRQKCFLTLLLKKLVASAFKIYVIYSVIADTTAVNNSKHQKEAGV